MVLPFRGACIVSEIGAVERMQVFDASAEGRLKYRYQ